MQVDEQRRQDDEEPVGDGVVEFGDVLRIDIVGLAPVDWTAVVLHVADIHRPVDGLLPVGFMALLWLQLIQVKKRVSAKRT